MATDSLQPSQEALLYCTAGEVVDSTRAGDAVLACMAETGHRLQLTLITSGFPCKKTYGKPDLGQ
jgi:hypothetical protein